MTTTVNEIGRDLKIGKKIWLRKIEHEISKTQTLNKEINPPKGSERLNFDPSKNRAGGGACFKNQSSEKERFKNRLTDA